MTDPQIKELLDILAKLPFRSKPLRLGEDPEGKIRCAGCGKLVDEIEIDILESPYTYRKGNKVIDPTCRECRSNVEGFSYIVCPFTQRVVGRIEPHVDPTGFEFERNKIYHVDKSPQAEIDLDINAANTQEGQTMAAVLIEKWIYDRSHKNKIINTPK